MNTNIFIEIWYILITMRDKNFCALFYKEIHLKILILMKIFVFMYNIKHSKKSRSNLCYMLIRSISKKNSYKLISKNYYFIEKLQVLKNLKESCEIYEVTQNNWFMKIDLIKIDQLWECIQNLLLFLYQKKYSKEFDNSTKEKLHS